MVGSRNASLQIDKHEDNTTQADRGKAHGQPAKDCDVVSRNGNQTKSATVSSPRASGWKKFGQAAIDELEGRKTTYQVHQRDAVFIEPADGDAAAAPSLKSNKLWEGITRRKLELKYGVSRSQCDQSSPKVATSGTLSSLNKKYIPPHARLAARPQQHHQGDEHCSIRVTNLSNAVTESDLRELFSCFGRISHVHIPKDKEMTQSRGFGFVTYCSHLLQ